MVVIGVQRLEAGALLLIPIISAILSRDRRVSRVLISWLRTEKAEKDVVDDLLWYAHDAWRPTPAKPLPSINASRATAEDSGRVEEQRRYKPLRSPSRGGWALGRT